MKQPTIKLDIKDTDIFFIADPHFHHANIIRYTNRPFNDVREMDKVMISNWNNTVGDHDTVFILGDFCLGGSGAWVSLLKSLNGLKWLILGNHDRGVPSSEFQGINSMTNLWIQDKQRITLCHYPMLSWYQSHHGAWQLFGHVHGRMNGDPRLTPNQLDVGVENIGYAPISYQQVKEIITTQNLRSLRK